MANDAIEATYRRAQARLSSEARAFTPEQLATPVPCCPGWTVKDVLGHLVGIIDDAMAGRISGPPSDEVTAAEVAAYATVPVDEVLDRWDEQTPAFASLVAQIDMWPAAFDVLSHELDILGALGDHRQRTGDEVQNFARRLGAWIDVGQPLRVETDTQTFGDPEADLVLRCTDFEFVRVRLGRRSAAQVKAMDWSADIGDDALRLCFFGPSLTDIVE